MSNKVQVDQTVLRILYYRYKDYILPIIACVVSWFVFLQFGFPQIQTFLAEKDQVAASEQTLAVMTQNYNLIASEDSTQLQNLLNTANAALPQDKDFAGILTAISNAAGASGVTLNDYTFQIGDVTGTATPAPQDQQSVKITLTINGSLDQTKDFLIALQQQTPISDVTDITILTTSSSTVNASFFYSPLPKITVDATNPIGVISNTEKKMLEGFGGDTGDTLLFGKQTPTITPTVIPTFVVSPTVPVSTSSAVGSTSASL